MFHQERLMMFQLNMVDYPMSFLSLSTWNLFCWRSRGDHSKMFLLTVFCCGTPPSCLKVVGWVVVVGGLQHFSVSLKGPSVLGLGLKGLGPGLDNFILLPTSTGLCWGSIFPCPRLKGTKVFFRCCTRPPFMLYERKISKNIWCYRSNFIKSWFWVVHCPLTRAMKLI